MANLAPATFVTWRERIKLTTRLLRQQENKRLQRKEASQNIKAGNCEKHVLCSWIRKYWKNIKENKESELQESAADNQRQEKSALEQAKSLEEAMYKVNEKIKKEDEEKLRDKVVTVYGGVQLDKEERAFLSLGPDFSLLEELELESARLDFGIGVTKVRWQRMGLDPSEVKRFQTIKEVEDEEQVEEVVHIEERVFDPDKRK